MAAWAAIAECLADNASPIISPTKHHSLATVHLADDYLCQWSRREHKRHGYNAMKASATRRSGKFLAITRGALKPKVTFYPAAGICPRFDPYQFAGRRCNGLSREDR